MTQDEKHLHTARPEQKSHGAALAAAGAACLIWSGSLIASKSSYDSMGPFSLGLVRFSLAAVLLLAMWGLRCLRSDAQARERDLPRGRDMFLCAMTGFVGTTLYFAGENYGVMLLPASTSSLIVGAFPALCLLLECLAHHTRPAAGKLVGIAVAFVGVAMLAALETSSGGGDAVLGMIALLLGGLCWAAYNIMMGPLLDRYSTLSVTAWQTLFGAIGFVPFALFEGVPTSTPSPTALASLAYLVLGCTVAAFMLYNRGLRKLSPSTAGALVNLIPVFGLLLSVLVLGEPLGLQQVLGGVLIVAGIFLTAREQRS